MASDIKIVWDNRGKAAGDIEYDNGDLTREGGLETAVWMSLFTDRRADIDDNIPDGTTNRRGWWGDLVADTDGDQIGSRLWLLDRSATTEDAIVDAEFYIREALQWMIDDDVCESIDVVVERQSMKNKSAILGFKVSILQSDGNIIAITFNDLWENQVS